MWDQGGRKTDVLEVVMKSITTIGAMAHGVVGRKTAIIREGLSESWGFPGATSGK